MHMQLIGLSLLGSTSQPFDGCAELLSTKLMFTMASTSFQSHVVILNASGRMLKEIDHGEHKQHGDRA